jgi:hypothetical protein
MARFIRDPWLVTSAEFVTPLKRSNSWNRKIAEAFIAYCFEVRTKIIQSQY